MNEETTPPLETIGTIETMTGPVGDTVVLPASAIPRSSGMPQAAKTTVEAPQPIRETPIHPVLCHANGLCKFTIGEIIPLKGVNFEVQNVDGIGMILMAHSRIQKRNKKKGR